MSGGGLLVVGQSFGGGGGRWYRQLRFLITNTVTAMASGIPSHRLPIVRASRMETNTRAVTPIRLVSVERLSVERPWQFAWLRWDLGKTTSLV